jgi:2-hydroxy-6-oxonona-2,4-dienedioate hydrolase
MLPILASSFVALALLVVGLHYHWYRVEMQAIRLELVAGAHVQETSCGGIEYASHGDGPPVVLINATGGGYDQSLLMGRLFVGEGFRWIAPSRFGYLRTPRPLDASPEAQADSLICLLDALGLERVAVLGMSAGGPPALQMSIRHPDRVAALILLSTAAWAPPSPELDYALPAPDWVYDVVFGSDFLFWLLVRYATPALTASFGATPEIMKHVAADERQVPTEMVRLMMPVSLRRDGLDLDAAMVDELRRDDRFLERYPLSRIRAPTLVVHARDDAAAPFAWGAFTAANIPGAVLIDYDDGGHVLLGHIGHSREAIREFLRLLAPPEGAAGATGVGAVSPSGARSR